MAIEEAVQVVLAVVDQMDKMDIFSLSGRDFLHKVFSNWTCQGFGVAWDWGPWDVGAAGGVASVIFLTFLPTLKTYWLLQIIY